MKKSVVVLLFVLVMTVLIVMTASATKPETVEGYVHPDSLDSDGVDFWYDVCDPYLAGRVVQPLETPGTAVHGIFTAGDNQEPCPLNNDNVKSGTCEITLIPVELPGDPDSKPGRAVINRCTDELKGYHGNIVIDYQFSYVARYHVHP